MLEAHDVCCVEDIIFKRPVIPKNHSVIYRNDLWLKVNPSNIQVKFLVLLLFLALFVLQISNEQQKLIFRVLFSVIILR